MSNATAMRRQTLAEGGGIGTLRQIRENTKRFWVRHFGGPYEKGLAKIEALGLAKNGLPGWESQRGRVPFRCSRITERNRSREPITAVWIITMRSFSPFSFTHVRSKRSGMFMSS